MPLSTLVITIDENNSGPSVDKVTGVPCFLGTCSAGVVDQVVVLGPDSDFDAILGQGPLRDAIVDHLKVYGDGSNPYVLAVPITKADTGTVGAVTKTQTGADPALVLGTTCDMDADVLIKCTTAGASTVAKVAISLDGGLSWDKTNVVVTEDTDIGIPDVGVSAKFNFSAASLAEDDTWSFSTTAPTATLVFGHGHRG